GNAILAPADEDAALWACIKALREQGETVIQCLPGQKGSAEDMGCSRQLKNVAGQWQVSG
ncbi:hypothetical protein MNBD_GAMMA11-192, partial [hydrothermal vent metagenome]